MSAISYARTPVVHAAIDEDDPIVGMWRASIPLEAALGAGTAPKAAAVHALVNHGRWVVSCPDCASAQLACPADRRFMCHECANIAIGVQWRPVLWPKDPAALSDALAGRVDVTLQNLDPGETIEQLLAQNAVLAAARKIDGITILPVVETDGAKGAVASEYEGHEHRWPKRVEPRTDYSCAGCDLVLPGHVITTSRDTARTPAETAKDEAMAREKAGR